MTHISSHIIIGPSSKDLIDALPKDKQDKIDKILEKADHKIDKVLAE